MILFHGTVKLLIVIGTSGEKKAGFALKSTSIVYQDNNLKQVSYSNATIATPTVNFEYDPNFNRITKMTDGTGVTTYNYNPVELKLGSGMLGSIVGPVPNSTIAYDYDELGRVKERGINGVKQSAVFDNLGRVTKITNALGDFINDYVDATGRLKSVTYPNKQKTMFSYFDNLGDQRLKEIRHLNPNSSLLTSHSYSYNPVGNITQWIQQIEAQDPKIYTFQYDFADQLIGVSRQSLGGGGNFSFFTYDKAGNRLSEQIDTKVTLATFNNLNQLIKKDEGAGPVRFEGSVDKPAAVDIKKGNATVPANVDVKNNFNTPVPLDVGTNTVSVVATDYSGNKNTTTNNFKVVVAPGGKKTLTYDLNGNLTGDGTYTYEYDAENRCTSIQSVNGGSTYRAEFGYNGFGSRVKIVEKLNGVITSTRNFLWCGTSICDERDGNNNIVKQFFSHGFKILGGPNAGNYTYNRDHLGSIREVTDNTGKIIARYDYDIWGKRILVSGTDLADFGYTGHFTYKPSWMTQEHVLTLYRIYRPDLGRWTSRDPIGNPTMVLIQAAFSGQQLRRSPLRLQPEIVQGPNLYWYVRNNSINKKDPWGLAPIDPTVPGWGSALASGTLQFLVAFHLATNAVLAADDLSPGQWYHQQLPFPGLGFDTWVDECGNIHSTLRFAPNFRSYPTGIYEPPSI